LRFQKRVFCRTLAQQASWCGCPTPLSIGSDKTGKITSVDDHFWQMLPNEFEAKTYRSLHPDLAHMTDAELLEHYENSGRKEGRTANRLRDRNDFAKLVPKDAAVLEIGPFNSPLLRGPSVSYFDVLSREELVARARSCGFDPAGVPNIDYISPTAELSTVNRCFDVVISSHCLEHQPDIVGHLQGVGGLLRPGGAYFLLVPDKRYCFDHFIPLSNLAEVIVAYHERRKVHTLRSLIEHRALTTHNDSLRHWQGDHGVMLDDFEQRLQGAFAEFATAKGKYIDVHTWYFIPDSAVAVLSALQRMGLSRLGVRRVYSTRYGRNEFWMILISDGPGREAHAGGQTPVSKKR
jgi:SAM-dependent methyltransferase